jgi:hypothetical protein
MPLNLFLCASQVRIYVVNNLKATSRWADKIIGSTTTTLKHLDLIFLHLLEPIILSCLQKYQ